METSLARRVILSIAALLVACCIGLSLIAAVGAAVLITQGTPPFEVLPLP